MLNKRIFYHLILLVFPLLFVIAAINAFRGLNLFYTIINDPDYAYLFNGLNLSRFKMHLGHVDHPGSPVQYVVAINIWIIQLFNLDKSIVENVIINPEIYMKSSYFSIIAIDALAIFVAGNVVRKAYGIAFALFVQILPFVFFKYLVNLARLRPETMQISAMLVFIAVLIMYLNRDKFKFNKKHYPLLLALAVGYGISLKIYFAPFFLIPLILLETKKSKYRFVLFTLASFSIFALPVLYRLEKFYKWIRNLITHSGVYGNGEKNFIETGSFFSNFELLYKEYTGFFWTQFLSIGAIILLLVFRRRISKHSKLIFKLMYSLSISLFLYVVLVAKHFSLHYMMPVQNIYIFQILLMVLLLNEILPKRYFTIVSIAVFAGIALNLFFTKRKIYQLYSNFEQEKQKSIKTSLEQIDKYRKDQPFFIYGSGYGDPCIENALNFGIVWAGRYRKEYIETIKQEYPNSYYYLNYKRQFNFWHEDLDTLKLINSTQAKGAILFIGNDVDSIRQNMFREINDIYQMPFEIDTLFRNVKMNESLYRISLLKNH